MGRAIKRNISGKMTSKRSMHVYEIRPRNDHRGFNLISDALPFGRLGYGEPNAVSNAIGYAKFFTRSHQATAKYAQDLGRQLRKTWKPGTPSARRMGFRIAFLVSV